MAQNCKIPGYFEAVGEERRLRENAYLGGTEVVCGVRIHQITPRLLAVLSRMESPYLDGGTITPSQSVRFLWALATEFNPSRQKRFWIFGRTPRDQFIHEFTMRVYREWDWEYVLENISKFLEDTFLDSPQGAETTPYCSSQAWLELRMSKLMGWTWEHTQDVPLRRIYQLLRCEAISEGDKTLVNKLSDGKKDEFLHRLNTSEGLN